MQHDHQSIVWNYGCYHVYRRTSSGSCTAFLDTSYVRRLPNQAMQGFSNSVGQSPVIVKCMRRNRNVHSVRTRSKSNGYNGKGILYTQLDSFVLRAESASRYRSTFARRSHAVSQSIPGVGNTRWWKSTTPFATKEGLGVLTTAS